MNRYYLKIAPVMVHLEIPLSDHQREFNTQFVIHRSYPKIFAGCVLPRSLFKYVLFLGDLHPLFANILFGLSVIQ